MCAGTSKAPKKLFNCHFSNVYHITKPAAIKFLNSIFQMKKSFGELTWDYVVFGILVVVTTVVPLLGRYIGKKKETSAKADYIFAAGSSISMVSMMLSVARGTLGVRSFLGKFRTHFFKFIVNFFLWFQDIPVKYFIGAQECGKRCMVW